MKRQPNAAWRAKRALLERATPTFELVAEATSTSVRALKLRARREGWRVDRMSQEDLAERLRVMTAMLVEHVEALGRKALEEGGKINKSEIDGILSLIKGLGTMAEITRTEESAINNQSRRDEDLGDVLTHIHDRIVELARELAAQMVAEDHRLAGR